MPFRPEGRYRRNPQVALRPEPFGALAYHFGQRRLTFLKDLRLVDLVEALGEHASVHEAIRARGIPAAQERAFLRALATLADGDMIIPA